MRKIIIFSLSTVLLLTLTSLSAQTRGKVLQKAHDNKIAAEQFIPTDTDVFRVNVYTVDEKSMTGRTHHWFLDLRDPGGKPLNYAKVKMSGYLKSDPSVKFSYVNPVFSMCNEGKYVIGFVRVRESGPWVLEFNISDKGKEDTFTQEIVVKEES